MPKEETDFNSEPRDDEPVLEAIDLSKHFVPGNVLVISGKAFKMLETKSPEERKKIMQEAQKRSEARKRFSSRRRQPLNGEVATA
jgi:hypothetical protein